MPIDRPRPALTAFSGGVATQRNPQQFQRFVDERVLYMLGLLVFVVFALTSQANALLEFLPDLSTVGSVISVQATEGNNNTIRRMQEEEKEEEDPIEERPLNIVLLYADDWRHDSIGTESSHVVTPFLDGLAARGIRFTHSCVTTAVCWISRANMYTGQYMSRHNTTRVRQPYWYDHWHHTMPHLLSQHHYFTGHVGKWHFDGFPSHVASSWNVSTIYHGNHWYRNPKNRKQLIHVTERNEQDAMDFLRNRPKNQPFFLSVCFFAPHCIDSNPGQYQPQPQSMKKYYNKNMTLPVPFSATEDAWNKMPYFFNGRNEGRKRWHWRFDKPEKYQAMMKNYYRLIAEVDTTCQRIVEELERQNLVNDTLIIFTTDNGLFHAEHGLAGKWYPHQESIRVPLIVLDPRMPPERAGTTQDDFVLSIDLAPTILHAANITPHPRMQGQDLSVLYRTKKPTSSWRREFFYEHPTHGNKYVIPGSTALIRKDYKYIRWSDFQLEQLFHLEMDPFELNDLLATNHSSRVNTDFVSREMKTIQPILEEMRQRHDELAQQAK